jgi:6-phosphogluconolactonase
MVMPQTLVEVVENPEVLAQQGAAWIVGLAERAQGRFAIALSGGSTPRRLYEVLGESPWRDRLPWDRVHWFWGDERFVPWDHPDSNYGMVRKALLGHVPAPTGNVHGVPYDGTPAEAARAYQATLRAYYGAASLDPARPLFDVQLLGLGPDGHTASLFPGTAVLEERGRWVAEVIGAKEEARITLTYPALESSRHTAFLVAGAEKRAILARARAGDKALPAARLTPQGDLLWFVDKAASG